MVAGSVQSGTFLQIQDGRFVDDRWTNGRWDLSQFLNSKGEQDWDAVSVGKLHHCCIVLNTTPAAMHGAFG